VSDLKGKKGYPLGEKAERKKRENKGRLIRVLKKEKSF